MRKLSLGLLLACCLVATAGAETLVVAHQGRLLDGSDQPVDGQVELRFAVYELPIAPGNQAETPKWTETYTLQATHGFYAVNLGDTYRGTKKTIDATVFAGGDRYLEVAVRGTSLLPRMQIGAAPIALDARRLGGRAPEEYALKTALDDASTQLRAAVTAEATARDVAVTSEGTARAAAIAAEAAARDAAVAAEASARDAAVALKLDKAGGAVTGTLAVSGALTAASFSGSGADLTGLAAAAVTGALADGNIPGGIPRLGADNAFAGSNRFVGNVGIGTTGVASEKLEVSGNVKAGAYLAYVAAVDDFVTATPYRTGLYSGTSTRVVTLPETKRSLFTSPSVLAQNDWDWYGDDAWAHPALPAGFNKVWAKVTFSLTHNFFQPASMRLRREYYDPATTSWKRMPGDPDIDLGTLSTSWRTRAGTVSVWVPWWKTDLDQKVFGGPTQRLLVSSDATTAGLQTIISSTHVELYASNTAKVQSFPTENNPTGTALQGQPSLEVPGDFIRTIARWQGFAPDSTDNGVLAGRRIDFVKRANDTGLRVSWTDNFRVLNNAQACQWEVLFNGKSCTSPAGLYWSKYEGATGSNRHDPSTVTGTCFGISGGGLPQGAVAITTRVGPVGSYTTGDCDTGWITLTNFEAEEVR